MFNYIQLTTDNLNLSNREMRGTVNKVSIYNLSNQRAISSNSVSAEPFSDTLFVV